MIFNRCQTFEILETMLEANKHYVKNNMNKEIKIPYISGQPGIGKSSLVESFAKHHTDYKYHRISLTSLEAYELKGLLYPNDKTNKVDILPLDIIPFQEKSIIFIDEINASYFDVQKTLLDLFHEKEILGTKINQESFIICAGNKKKHDMTMYDLITPLADRCVEIELVNNVDDVLSYLYNYDITLFNIFNKNKNVLSDIINFNNPISFRKLTSIKYYLNKYLNTKERKYKNTMLLHLKNEDLLTLIIENIQTDIDYLSILKQCDEQNEKIKYLSIIINELDAYDTNEVLKYITKDMLYELVINFKTYNYNMDNLTKIIEMVK